MGFGKRLTDWSAASNAFEQERDAGFAEASLRPVTMTRLLVTVLTVMAPIVAVAGTWGGIVIGRSVEGWSRLLGLAVPGWMVILGTVVGALVLFALAAGLRYLDEIHRETRR